MAMPEEPAFLTEMRALRRDLEKKKKNPAGQAGRVGNTEGGKS